MEILDFELEMMTTWVVSFGERLSIFACRKESKPNVMYFTNKKQAF